MSFRLSTETRARLEFNVDVLEKVRRDCGARNSAIHQEAIEARQAGD